MKMSEKSDSMVELSKVIEIINDFTENAVKTCVELDLDWRSERDALMAVKARVLDNFNVEECRSCGKLIEVYQRYCDADCATREHLESM
jgi:hypothetical protein